VPLNTDTESASVGALAEGGEGAGCASGVGVDQPAPPARTVGRGDPDEPVIGGLGRELLPTLLGEDREGVVVCHVSSLGLSPPWHMGQIADLWPDFCHFGCRRASEVPKVPQASEASRGQCAGPFDQFGHPLFGRRQRDLTAGEAQLADLDTGGWPTLGQPDATNLGIQILAQRDNKAWQ
jgi:hypothetical protein